jgi:hypothetical protein
MLEDINKDTANLEKYKNHAGLKFLFKHAFEKEHKFILPEGDPPFKEDDAPLGMSPANFLMEMRRLYIFCRTDLTAPKRESLFISLLESLHPSESKVLLAVKDQNLNKLYPKITRQLLVNAGLVSGDSTPAEPPKRGRGRPPGSKNKNG